MHADADLTRPLSTTVDDGVDGPRAEAADTVRRALVRLRGGAPLLSPADERLLLQWLDGGVTVGRILAALEVAADRRVARRVRAPLALSHARRLLGVARAPRRAPRAVPLVVAEVAVGARWGVQVPTGAPASVQAALAGLASRLAALPDDDPEGAAALAADWALAAQDEAWRGLADGERAEHLDRAAAALADVLDLLDEAETHEVLEAHARAALRDAWPAWSVARLVDEVLG